MTWKNTVQKIGDSQIYLGLVTKNFLEDPMCAAQLGAALLLDKPIIFMVEAGTVIPERLKRVADKIEYFENTEDMGTKVEAALREFT